VVALPPDICKLEIVVEALLNMFAPVKMLLSDNKVEEAELPPPPVTQTPLTEKHFPVARSIEPVKLEVAEPVIFNKAPWIPFAKVVVELLLPIEVKSGKVEVPVLVWLAKFKMVEFPPQVVRAVFSTRLSFKLDFKFAVVVPVRVEAPEA